MSMYRKRCVKSAPLSEQQGKAPEPLSLPPQMAAVPPMRRNSSSDAIEAANAMHNMRIADPVASQNQQQMSVVEQQAREWEATVHKFCTDDPSPEPSVVVSTYQFAFNLRDMALYALQQDNASMEQAAGVMSNANATIQQQQLVLASYGRMYAAVSEHAAAQHRVIAACTSCVDHAARLMANNEPQ